jgi:hypothetical protein
MVSCTPRDISDILCDELQFVHTLYLYVSYGSQNNVMKMHCVSCEVGTEFLNIDKFHASKSDMMQRAWAYMFSTLQNQMK